MTENEVNKESIIRELYDVIMDRRENPAEGSYTNYLFSKGIGKICKKFGEEAIEVVISSLNGEKKDIVYEIADLQYHLMVLMAEKGITPDDIYDELRSRR
ncbi:MAG: phosphoribosyl-ATP diphosphatase [Clostridiaceae bacterium]|jgi:phosphoribosyl-ATP pyrophosphohydrolase|nr:phosphoribosyl-ATP diphosphatase [Oscillospiraceae bacterium]NLO62139.1 phosphoribosyl-ATP diphosphatase [Clostridiaceae bacterium]